MPNATTAPKGEATIRQKDIVWDPAVGGRRPNTVPATPNRQSFGYDHIGPGLTRGSSNQPMVDNAGARWKGASRIHDRKGRRKQLARNARRRHALIMSYYRDPQRAQRAIETRNAIQEAFNAAFEPKHTDPADNPARRAQIAVEKVTGQPAEPVTEGEWVEVGYEDLPPKSGAEQFAAVDLSDGLDDMKVGELRKMAVALGMKGGWKGPKKPELIAFIRENRS